MTEPIALSQLPAGGPVTGDEQIPAVQAGQTVRIPASALLAEQQFFYFQEGPVVPFVTATPWRKRAPVKLLSIRAWCAEPAQAAVEVMLSVDGVDYLPAAVHIPSGATESVELELDTLETLPADAAVRVKMTTGACADLGVRVTYR